MTFSCTKKVLDKLKKYKAIENDKVEIGLFNWYIDLINLERKNYFLFTHSKTLFSFFIYAGTKKELQNIETLFESKLQEQIIKEIGTDPMLLQKIFPEKKEYRFIKTNSRAVLGSMNDFKNQIKVHIWHKGSLNQTYDLINHLLNDVPMGALKYKCSMGTLKYKCPRNAMKQELGV